MEMDRYSAPLRVVLNRATLKAYVIHNWAKSEFDLMQMSWRNLGTSELRFRTDPACTCTLYRGILSIRTSKVLKARRIWARDFLLFKKGDGEFEPEIKKPKGEIGL